MGSKMIGDILISKGILTKEQLESAVKEQKRTGEYLGTVMVRMGLVNENNLLTALSEQFNIPYRSIKDVPIEDKVITAVPPRYAWHYKFMPLKLKGNILMIAVSNPLDIWLPEDIKLNLGYDVEVVLASEQEIRDCLRKYYGVGAETVDKILEKSTVKSDKAGATDIQAVEDISHSAEDASVIKLVNQILTEAIQSRATDIHIEPFRDTVKLRYRIDGVLYETPIPPDMKYLHPSMVSRVKIISGLDVVERRVPQDGRAKVKIGNRETDLRISVLPSLYGEDIVIRILPTQLMLSMDDLGLEAQEREKLEYLIKKPHGIVFLTGPTGSGKTTTLYACLSHINAPGVKIITIEDPAEYELAGVVQIQINPKVGLTFANALRSILRHDPDVLMIGEVRDFETAELAIRTALTGHLVFSTLHTNDAASGVTRLLDMGIEPYLVASSVESYIAQRLVRLICPQCRQEVPSEDPNIKGMVFIGKGCDFCKNTGYHGRIALYEILFVDDKIKELILQKAAASEIKRAAVEAGMRTLRDRGIDLIKSGRTTIEEVLRVTELGG